MGKYYIPDVTEDMLRDDFWISRLPEEGLIMNERDIKEFNRRTREEVKNVYDLRNFKDTLSKEELKGYIEEYSIPKETRYDAKGREVTKEFYDKLIYNTNLDNIKDKNPVRFGIAVNNSRVRSFPEDEGVFKIIGEIEFDRFQETMCYALEAVAVLHESRDKEWYFIQMYNYRGWTRKENIAIAENKDDVFNYIDSKDFLVVTGNFVRTQFNHYDSRVSYKNFYMGTRIPLQLDYDDNNVGNQGLMGNYVIKLAVRDEEGKLEFSYAVLSKNSDVNIGYLPYTRKEIIKQAFKLLGDRYDWGNKNCGRDCSGFIIAVYDTFGFRLPRNADDQEIGAGKSFKFTEGSSIDERKEVFKNVKPGAAIFKDGHVMMYIGDYDGTPYMIHAFNCFTHIEDKKAECVQANEVAVTSTLLQTVPEHKYIEVFTSLLQYE